MKFPSRGMAGSLAGLFVAVAGPSHAADAVADPCAGRTDVLGVSRIVEIDTAAGPTFGAQYQDASFLEDGEVVLTFDDGPLRHYTQRVLDALDTQCAKATFFIVGRMAIGDPEMLKETARRGHTIGVHTWSHKKLTTISAEKAKDEIELGLSATVKALGAPVAPFFRFPYLRDTKATIGYLGERRLGVFGIDVDSRDFNTRNPGVVQRSVMSQLESKKKGIILMHDIQPSTAGSIKSLLGELKAKGFRIVHMVPKSSVVTLPEYDAIAGRELAQKVVAAAKNPLANRSVVWSSGTGKTGDAAPAAPGDAEVLPWLNGTNNESAPQPAAAPAIRPPRRPEPPGLSNDPWQIRTMGN